MGVSHPAISDGFAPFTCPPKLNVDGWYGPTRLTSLSALMFFSRPAAQRHAFTAIRRNPSFNKSSDAPCVVVNTRPVLPDALEYVRTHATGICCLSAAGGESGVIPFSTWPRARIVL